MSNLHIPGSPLEPNFTTIPNVILDVLMPQLTGAEEKIVRVICRQTYGWQKPSDRISNSQMSEKTGLELSALKRAAKALADKKIIIRHIGTGRVMTEYSLNYNMNEWGGVVLPPPEVVKMPPPEVGETQPPGGGETPHNKRDTQKTLNKEKEKQPSPNGEQVNLLLNIIYREINYSLYKDYKLRKIIENALKIHTIEYLEACLCGYLQDKWAKDNNVWNFYKFFSEQLQMEKYNVQGRQRVKSSAERQETEAERMAKEWAWMSGTEAEILEKMLKRYGAPETLPKELDEWKDRFTARYNQYLLEATAKVAR